MKFSKLFFTLSFIGIVVLVFFVSPLFISKAEAAQYVVGESDNLTLTRGQTSMELSWTTSIASSVNQTIYRNGSPIATVGTGISYYFDSGLTCNTSYSYEIRSSFGSAYMSASTLACTPAAPTNISATQLSSTSVRINWTDNATNETEYYVAKDGNYFGSPYPANTTSATFTVTCGVSSNYYVFASNAGGSSSGISMNFTPGCVPSAPTGLTANTISGSQVNLSWNAVSGATSYTVTYSAGSFNTAGTTYSMTGLSCGTIYGVGVKANNASGSSPESNVNATTSACPDTTNPSVSGTATIDGGGAYTCGTYTNTGTVLLNTSCTDNVACTEICFCQDTANTCTPSASYFCVYGSGNPLTGQDLRSSDGYMRYRGKDAAGNYSSVGSCRTIFDRTAPSFSFSPTSGTFNSSGMNVNIPVSDGLSGVAYQRHCYTQSASCDPGTTNASTFVSAVGFTGSEALGDWKICVRARDNAGNWSSTSCGGNYTRVADISAPTGVSATFSYDGSSPAIERIDVSWNSVSGATSYTLYEKVNGGSWSSILSTGSTVAYIRQGTLSCGSSYEYAVIANGASGSSSMSASSGAMTYTVPGSLPNFGVWANNDSSAWLSTWWGGAYPGTYAVPRYNIFRGGSLIATIPQYDYIDAGRSSNTSYSYSIQPANACGGGVTSPSYTMRTLGSISMYHGGSTQTSISACWSDPVNPSHPDVSAYNYRNILRNSGAASYSSPVGSTSGCWNDTGLSCGTGYTYSVRSGLTVLGKGNYAGGAGALVESPTYTFYTSSCNNNPNTPTLTSPSTGTCVARPTQFCATVSDPDGDSVRARFNIAGSWYYGNYVSSGGSSCYSYNGSNLTNATWYAYAEDSVGANSGNSSSRTISSDGTAPTPNPPSVSGYSTGQNSLYTSMSSGIDALCELHSTAYGFSINGSSYFWQSSPSYSFSGLSCQTNYTVYGKIRDAVGNETSVGTTSITTDSCVVAPSTPSVDVTPKSGAPEATAVISGGNASYYLVYKYTPATGHELYANIPGTSLSIANLKCPQSYTMVFFGYNTDVSLGGGVDGSCSALNAIDSPNATNKKCTSRIDVPAKIDFCTKGFFGD